MNAVNTTTAGPPFDYYYGTESKTFSFVRIPRIFFRDDRFRQLSSEAKLLYGLMLDRLSLSQKNGWLDDRGRVYIIYTIDQVRKDLDCGRDKAMKTLDELDVLGGIGLIEKNRKGRGLPSLIYVKNFVKNSEPVHDIDRKEELAEVGKTEALKSENPTSGDLKNRLLKVGKPDRNNPENNQNNMSHTDHIHLSYGMAPVPVQEVILTDKTMDRMSKPPSGRITVKMPESYSAAACDVPAVSYPIKLQLKPGGKTVTASQSHSLSCDHSISVAADSVSGASPPGAECSYRELVRRNINYDRLIYHSNVKSAQHDRHAVGRGDRCLGNRQLTGGLRRRQRCSQEPGDQAVRCGDWDRSDRAGADPAAVHAVYDLIRRAHGRNT